MLRPISRPCLRNDRGSLVRECREVDRVGVCRLYCGQRCPEVALAHLEALLGDELDVQVVLCDRVVHCGLYSLAERSVLVDQGKAERAVSREPNFLLTAGRITWSMNIVVYCP